MSSFAWRVMTDSVLALTAEVLAIMQVGFLLVLAR